MKKILSIILLAGLSVNLLAHTEDATAQDVDRFAAFKSYVSVLAQKPVKEWQFIRDYAHKKMNKLEISDEDQTHAKKLLKRGVAIGVAVAALIGGVIVHKGLLRKPTANFEFSNCDVIYVPGFGSVPEKSMLYMDAGVIPTNATGEDFEDTKKKLVIKKYGNGFSYTPHRSRLGQADDVAVIAKQVDAARKKVVLFGESRGASAIANFIGKASEEQLKKIQAVVLDSPFSSLEDVLDHRIKRFHLSCCVTAKGLEKWLAKRVLTKYEPAGMQPINSLENPSDTLKDIPILLICSKKDTEVPYTSSEKIYKQLKESGCQKAHILEFDRGSHGRIMQGKDKIKYRNAVHAYYGKYGVEHVEKFADAGQESLAQTQPEVGSFDRK